MNSVLKTNNKVLILLTVADVFTWGPYIIISALAGLYLANKFGHDVVQFVGIGTAIYYVTKGVFQLPIGALSDKLKKDRDEIILLFFGVILMGIPFLFYPLIDSPYQYYILQFIFGLGTSLNVINWRKLFALNIKQGREGTSYAKYEAVISVSAAVIGIFVGYIANLGDTYFDIIMSCGGIMMIAAGIWISLIYSIKERKSDI